MSHYYQTPPIPKAFIWKRLHSFTGFWLVLFLIEHLLTNSQAALFIGDDGSGFVRAVNGLKNLPYLPFIEIFLLGVPLVIHALWGIHYLFTGQSNAFPSDGSRPSLGQYAGNRAYTWQRITSWILLFGILAHVIHMRFLEYPASVKNGLKTDYMILVDHDNGLSTLSPRLGFEMYNAEQLQAFANQNSKDKNVQSEQWMQTISQFHPNLDQVVIVAPSFGLIELMMVRETFKSPWMIFLYTVLVIAASFHAFNGLWSFLITWGVTLTHRSQQIMRKCAIALMVLISFLGFAAIWGTYWFNLTG